MSVLVWVVELTAIYCYIAYLPGFSTVSPLLKSMIMICEDAKALTNKITKPWAQNMPYNNNPRVKIISC